MRGGVRGRGRGRGFGMSGIKISLGRVLGAEVEPRRDCLRFLFKLKVKSNYYMKNVHGEG